MALAGKRKVMRLVTVVLSARMLGSLVGETQDDACVFRESKNLHQPHVLWVSTIPQNKQPPINHAASQCGPQCGMDDRYGGGGF